MHKNAQKPVKQDLGDFFCAFSWPNQSFALSGGNHRPALGPFVPLFQMKIAIGIEIEKEGHTDFSFTPFA